MKITISNIRKPWAAFLAWSVISYVVGLYPYLTLFNRIEPFQVAQAVADAIAIYALFGYVVRKPIGSIAFRFLAIALSLINLARAAVVAYLVVPTLSPWQGLRVQYVEVLLLLSVLVALLMALALWLYATTPQAVNDTISA